MATFNSHIIAINNILKSNYNKKDKITFIKKETDYLIKKIDNKIDPNIKESIMIKKTLIELIKKIEGEEEDFDYEYYIKFYKSIIPAINKLVN